MIHGAHVILYTRDADADRAFVRDVLGFPHVDVGHGWLIFALPPAEVAMHPAEGEPSHELYLMCDDVRAFVREMKLRSVACSSVSEQPWGSLVTVTLPSGAELGVYQPKHASPKWGARAVKRKGPAKTRQAPSAPKRRTTKKKS